MGWKWEEKTTFFSRLGGISKSTVVCLRSCRVGRSRHVCQQIGALDGPPEPRECWRAALLREGHDIYNIDDLDLGLGQEVRKETQ